MSNLTETELLCVMQAVYNQIGRELKTGVPDNLRGRVNGRYLDLYEGTGATGFDVRVNGQKVGTYGFNKVRGLPERTYTEVEVTDIDALRADESDDFLDFCGRYVSDHIAELAVAYARETGELPAGVEMVEHVEPATPDGIRPNGTLRVKPEKVAAALGDALPATLAGLLGGGE